ncbi:MAG: chromosome partitioning protein ParA, partial [Acetatifactor sp.]|nr:chromosome partitioning protein ParA [Acetatifactor sp.]
VLAFVAAGGGTGSSVAAAACAMNFARKGKKALYLNLEKFGSADVFFQAEGNAGLGDVIYAIKSRKGNLSMKLESTVKCDVSGVYFYSPTKMALDIAELNADEIQQIISALKVSGGYDYIILDLDFSMDKNMLKIFDECNTIVFVADGSPVSNVKLERVVASLNVLEQQTDRKILMRCGILYNRFSSHTSQKAQIGELREFGGISRFEGFDIPRLLQQIKAQPVFDALE